MSAYPTSISSLFSEIVEKYGAKTALFFSENDRVSYRDLDERSNQIARFLLSKGIQKRDRVCLNLDKSLVPYSLIVACWKIGATYFSVDPNSPLERVKKIIDQCEPALVFSETPLALSDYLNKTILCEKAFKEISFAENFSTDRLEVQALIDGSDPAYIMFTSGSTGIPKGAVITVANLLNFISWTKHQYNFDSSDVFTQLNPLYFDNSVFDIYSAIFSGATLVPVDADTLRTPSALVEKISKSHCTVFFSVPSLLIYLQTMKLASRAYLGGLKKIIFGGEGYPKPKLLLLYRELSPTTQIYNVYGPTEATCICSSYQVSDVDFTTPEGFVALGSLIANFSGYILDEDQKSVAQGSVGELYLGGPCVGHGYFRRPEDTTKAFIQNPLNTSFLEKVYKTGDLVRVDPADDKLYFVGRKDSQIKHMGYRIELEEIQHCLQGISGINEAIVIQSHKLGMSRLIGIVGGNASANPNEIKEQLALKVPKYMVPEKIYVLESLPKNPNGKIDRSQLQEHYQG